jgi:N-acetyl-alpha-D-muramate 1-phosphate uridylyltransferase
MRAMILAAGRGERMGPLTRDRPKPLLEVNGESLIERHLRRLAAAGIRNVVVNLSYRGGQIRERLGDGTRWRLAIAYSDEGEPPLETAGGIVAALPLLGTEPFLLVNADVVTDFDFGRLIAGRAPPEARGRGCLVLVPNPAHNPDGDFGLDPGSRLTSGPPRYTYAGIARLDPALFAGLAPGARPLKPVLDAAIADEGLYGLRHDGLWFDVGTPARLGEAAAALR